VLRRSLGQVERSRRQVSLWTHAHGRGWDEGRVFWVFFSLIIQGRGEG
jgi:hypothetical protein